MTEELTHRFFETIRATKTGPYEMQVSLDLYDQVENIAKDDAQSKAFREDLISNLIKNYGLIAEQLEYIKKLPLSDILKYFRFFVHPQKPGQLICAPSYPKERIELNKLIDDLYEKNIVDFPNREDIFNLFAKAAMSGHLLPLARVVEKTYSKGSFREIGEKFGWNFSTSK